MPTISAMLNWKCEDPKNRGIKVHSLTPNLPFSGWRGFPGSKELRTKEPSQCLKQEENPKLGPSFSTPHILSNALPQQSSGRWKTGFPDLAYSDFHYGRPREKDFPLKRSNFAQLTVKSLTW